MFDLTVYKYNRLSGNEAADLPGLYSTLPPKRAARGREKDRLVLFLQFEERGSVFQGAQQEVLEKLSSVFYATKGTVTNALKTIVEQMNERLLARNLRVAREGTPALGIMAAAVLHEGMLYLAHAGPVQTFVISKDSVQHYYDPQGAGRGLGTSRTAAVRFYRSELQAGSLVLISVHPPANWSVQNLTGSAQLSLDNLRRRLLTQANDDLCFALLRVKPGSGGLQTSSLKTSEKPQSVPFGAAEPLPPGTIPVPEPPVDHAAVPQPERPDGEGLKPVEGVYLSGKRVKPQAENPAARISPLAGLANLFTRRKSAIKPAAAIEKTSQTTPVEKPAQEAPAVRRIERVEMQPPLPLDASQPWSPENGTPDFEPGKVRVEPAVDTRASKPARPSRAAVQAGGILSKVLGGWRAFRQRAAAITSRFLGRLLPGQVENVPHLSTGTMIFIAVAVPLVIVAVATTTYIQNGRGEQHRYYIAQAGEMAAQAVAQEDAILRQVNYEAALGYLDRAAEYGNSLEMQTMRRQINAAMDAADGIRRVDFAPALAGGFDRAVQISQIVSSPAEDLYLLDRDSGRVFRLVYTRPGYEVDTSFFCGPNMYGGLIVGPLVDIAAAPAGNTMGAVVMGLDGFGNLLYCSLDSKRTSAVTIIAPDAGWGSIKAIHYQTNTLNVLDVRSNAVWRFEGIGVEFFMAPRFYFGNDVPNLAEAIDIAVYQDDLFIINSDGRLIMCTFSSISTTPTRCNDPYPYRIGLAGQPIQEMARLEARFSQVLSTQPPEPSLYFLDPETPAIYQFSLGMTFIRELQPSRDGDYSMPAGPATAFTVTSGRNMILAYGNQIYSAPLPGP